MMLFLNISDQYELTQEITLIDETNVRDKIEEKISELTSGGSTRIGTGLDAGLEVSNIWYNKIIRYLRFEICYFVLSNSPLISTFLSNQQLYGNEHDEEQFTGGVIMLLTDGEDNGGKGWITDELEHKIMTREVKILSVALG